MRAKSHKNLLRTGFRNVSKKTSLPSLREEYVIKIKEDQNVMEEKFSACHKKEQKASEREKRQFHAVCASYTKKVKYLLTFTTFYRCKSAREHH